MPLPGEEVAAPTPAALVQPAPDTTALPAVRDTSIRMTAMNRNFGQDATLDVNRTLVAFHQNAIRAALGAQDYLVSATLELTLTSNAKRTRQGARTVDAHRLTRNWTEAGATWNCAVDSNTGNNKADCSGATAWSMGLPPHPFVVPATAQATIAPVQTGTVSFDVTADVRGFLSGSLDNHGWMLRSGLAVFAESADFTSRESATAPRLRLTVRRCSPAICNDGNACTADVCDSQALCLNVTAPDGTICNDGNACTQSDTCQAGACTGARPVVCGAARPVPRRRRLQSGHRPVQPPRRRQRHQLQRQQRLHPERQLPGGRLHRRQPGGVQRPRPVPRRRRLRSRHRPVQPTGRHRRHQLQRRQHVQRR